MGLFSSAEILAMADTVEAESMPDTAIIKTRTWTSDGGGGGTATYTAAGTVACRLSPLTPPERAEPQTGARVTPDSDWVVTLPADTVVSTESRIVIDGTSYEVTALQAPRSFEVARRVEVSEAN